jgi:hypothetical protein
MDNVSLRVYTLNAATLIISATHLEATLKIILLIISIVFTSMKIYDWLKLNIKKKDANND